jgi:hypothetical protein
MAIFAIVAYPGNSEPLRLVLEREFLGKFFTVASGHWLVSGSGTAKDIADKLGVGDAVKVQAIIYNVGGYYGFAPTTVWEWIKANWGTSSG